MASVPQIPVHIEEAEVIQYETTDGPGLSNRIVREPSISADQPLRLTEAEAGSRRSPARVSIPPPSEVGIPPSEDNSKRIIPSANWPPSFGM